MKQKIKWWIEACRLRTLPVSVSGVIAGCAYCVMGGCLQWAPALICLAFAVLAQVASNFANEYYDFKAGLDKQGREGPRRGVTEGDITPRAMKYAAWCVLALACLAGLSLIYWGGWWLLPVGICIALGAMAYSTGPYPLSRHGMGEVAVLLFFGIIPVNLTFYVQAASAQSLSVWYPGNYFDLSVALGSLSLGLMGANVLIVNNYRDAYDDEAVGKNTLAVLWGRKAVSSIYLFNGYAAVAAMLGTWMALKPIWLLIPTAYLCAHTMAWLRMLRKNGRELNPFLGITSMLMLFYALGLLLAA